MSGESEDNIFSNLVWHFIFGLLLFFVICVLHNVKIVHNTKYRSFKYSWNKSLLKT
jgi:hypothetical protein